MDSFAEEHRWHLAKITRWEWSRHTEDSAGLARRLADGIYEGADPNEFVDIVEQLSKVIGNGPAHWLAMLTTHGPDSEPTRRAFYALRADLYPERRDGG